MERRLSSTAHTWHPWLIHAIAHDFRLEDVWALPTPGGPQDFAALVRLMTAGDPARSRSRAVRALFALRWRLGALFGWDGPGSGSTLRRRLPAAVRDTAAAADFAALPFTPLYLLGDEFAAEIANRTMHGVLHLGWVPDGAGGHRGQMAVLVKPNGLLGAAYMAAIKPFRHLIVYPAMIGQIGRDWRAARGRDMTTAPC